jgi:hypothetical protein
MQFPVALSATGLAVTTANDLAQITVADDRPVSIAGLIVVQSSDVGDAAEEVLRIGLYRGVTTGTTGGTSLTVTALQQGGPTPGCSGTANWTNASTSGTLMLAYGFNIRVGGELWFPADCRPYIGQGGSPFSFRLLAAPADSVTLDVSVILLEG